MAVRLFVGNMPYGATEADLRSHFASVGEPSQVVIPVDRDTGRPRGFAFVEYLERPAAEAAVQAFNQQPFMGRSLSVSEARPREERGRAVRVGAAADLPASGPAASRRVRAVSPASGRRLRRPAPRRRFQSASGIGDRARNFSPPKKRAAGKKRWEKEQGPKGPIKERYTGRMDSMHDVNEDTTELKDFDDISQSEPKDDE